jgi:small subunit ribosomal protein S16
MERRSKLLGRYVEDLGWYNPILHSFGLSRERVAYWLGVGAQPTDTVRNLFVKTGLMPGPKVSVHARPKRQDETAEAEASPAPSAEPVSSEKQETVVEGTESEEAQIKTAPLSETLSNQEDEKEQGAVSD